MREHPQHQSLGDMPAPRDIDPAGEDTSEADGSDNPKGLSLLMLGGIGAGLALALIAGAFYFGLIPGFSGQTHYSAAAGSPGERAMSALKPRSPAKLAEDIVYSSVKRRTAARKEEWRAAAGKSASYETETFTHASGVGIVLRSNYLYFPYGVDVNRLNISLGLFSEHADAAPLIAKAAAVQQVLIDVAAEQEIEKLSIFISLDAIRKQVEQRLQEEITDAKITRVTINAFSIPEQ